ncbi:MAG: DUF1189 family protein [Candidatus Margulisiibacteriota bacterium]
MFGLIESFNPKFFKSLLAKRMGRCIGFLFVFIILLSIILSLKITILLIPPFSQAKDWINENMVSLVAQFPVLELNDGKIIQPKKTFSKTYGDILAIIIEPGNKNVLDLMDKYSNAIVITQQECFMKTNKNNGTVSEIKQYSLESVTAKFIPVKSGMDVIWDKTTYHCTPALVNQWLNLISIAMFPFFCLFFFFVYLFTKFFQLFTFSLAGMFFCSIQKAKIGYGNLLKIGIYALVPPSWITLLLIVVFNWFAPWWLYSIIYLIYLYFGIREAATT